VFEVSAGALLDALRLPGNFNFDAVIDKFREAERLLQCVTSQFTGEAPPAGIDCLNLLQQFLNIPVPSFK
jgi:hypothetical protein